MQASLQRVRSSSRSDLDPINEKARSIASGLFYFTATKGAINTEQMATK